jgi:alpha-2-macroglobulin
MRFVTPLAFFAVALLFAMGPSSAADLPIQDELERADALFKKKTYLPAIELYARVRQDETRPEGERLRAILQEGRAHSRIGHWDLALSTLRAAESGLSEDLSRARLQLTRGSLSLKMPHYYYEKDGERTRGRWVQGGTYHHTHREDHVSALKDLESALVILEGYFAASTGGDQALVGEFARGALQAAQALEALMQNHGGLNTNLLPSEEFLAFAKEAGIGSRLGVQPSAYYRLAEKVASSQGQAQTAALARYLRGLHLARVLDHAPVPITVKIDGGEGRPRPFRAKVSQSASEDDQAWVEVPAELDAFRALRSVALDFPGTEVEDDAYVVYAQLCQQHERFGEAVKTAEAFLERFPKSFWRSDVKALLQDIRHPQLEVTSPRAVLPDELLQIDVKYRNVKSLTCRIWKFDLGAILESRAFARDDDASADSVQDLVKRYLKLRKRIGRPDHEFKQASEDLGEYQRREMALTLPKLSTGAYLIELEGGGHVHRVMGLVSDLALVRKVDEQQSLIFVADARNGKAVDGARVVVRQKHTVKGLFGRYEKVTWNEGQTNADGVYERRHADSEGKWFHIEAFARRGDSYALSRFRNHAPPSTDESRGVVFAFCDRPVYRPAEMVNFVGNLRRKRPGGYDNLANESLTVRVKDAKGNTIYEQSLRTDEDGAVEDRLALGESPPLGPYRVDFRMKGSTVGSTEFRVEEYKKPEFEVLVAAPAAAQKLGGIVKVEVRARYFSGGAVADARLRYRIFRRSWITPDLSKSPWSSLYGSQRRGGGRGARELIREETGRLDADGNLVIEIEAAPGEDPKVDVVYEVEADVTDLSRRTISSAGRVVATQNSLLAKVALDRGFYRAGELAQVTIETLTPLGRPARSRGRFMVERLERSSPAEGEPASRTQVFVAEAMTTESGRGEIDYTFDSPGRFALSYRTRDDWGREVVGEREVWVTGSDYRADDFISSNLSVVADKSAYAPGETAFLMLNGTYADATVFLTVEADRKILQHQVVTLMGHGAVFGLRLSAEHAPNVFVHATMVQGGRFYQATRELRVPPREHLLDVKLSSHQKTYLPGETVKLDLMSLDHEGKPVSARFGLSVFDKAITYIAADSAPPIDRFFYGQKRAFYGNRNWGGNTSNSVAFRFRGHRSRAPRRLRYRMHGNPAGRWLDINVADAALEDQRTFILNLRRVDAWGEEKEETLDQRSADSAEGGFSAPSESPGLVERSSEMVRESSPLGSTASRLGRSRLPSSALVQDDSSDGEDLPWAAVQERRDFSDLASWVPDLRTDADGRAQLEVKLPDSLTTWVARARGMTRDTRVGEARMEFQTRKNVLVRLQAPRFFTEGDEVVVSAIVRNDLDESLAARVNLEISDELFVALDASERDVVLTAREELRVDWRLQVKAAGEAVLRTSVRTARESDAVVRRVPVLEYGRERVLTQTAILVKDDDGHAFEVELPGARKMGTSELELTLAPSLGSALLEALPYLIEYPYGCTEQTMSRFMPAVVVARTLKEAGVSLEDIAKKRRDLDDPKAPRRQSERPTLSSVELEAVVGAGLGRLESMQNRDGGFGWWRRDRSSVHLSCYVLHGLCEARRAGYTVPQAMLDGAVRFLRSEVPEISSLPLIAYASLALAEAGVLEGRLLDHAWKRRDELSAYARAQLALAFHRVEDTERANLMVRGLEDLVEEDAELGTCHWPGQGAWWSWSGDLVETNAAVLLALATIDSDHRLARPLSQWLVRNRSGNTWKSTRDTAASVLALARYMKEAGELDPDYTVKVSFGGNTLREFRIKAQNMFEFDNRLVIRGDALSTGTSRLVVEKSGKGTAYLSARLRYFSREKSIAAAGDGIQIQRRYYLLEPTKRVENRGGRSVTVRDFHRRLLSEGAPVEAGQEIEVELLVKADNNYEYVMVEDRKASGFEPLALRSGRQYANGLCSNMELRDEKVVFFITWLQQGQHRVTYRVRAETPGLLSAMPARGVAMYAPRLSGTSSSWRVSVRDAAR